MNRTMESIVHDDILEHLKYLCNRIDEERTDLIIEGINVFSGGDRFVAGKIINAGSYILTMSDDDEFSDCFKRLIKFTAPMYTETWGYLSYLQGLYRLKENGMLSDMVDNESLERLKKNLDWRYFVNIDDLSLIRKPTNFYGVAFGVARYRELLGWDDGNYSEQLFQKLMDHIVKYSGEYSYMDETPGEGRFDRYSLLIPAELCSTLHETGMEIPPFMTKMLKQSVQICISMANKSGHGIAFGRSIGSYGDTAVLEILSTAVALDLIEGDDLEIAYGYCTAITNKFISFWLDKETRSVNLWDKGRSTDAYRNKSRILGENLSLSCQIIHSHHQWLESKYKPVDQERWAELIKALPKSSYFCFAKNKYERGLAVIRDEGTIYALPMINGGGGAQAFYYATPYLTIPQSSQLLEAIPGSRYPNLMPMIKKKDGVDLMPVTYIDGIITQETEKGYRIKMSQDQLCQIGGADPLTSDYGKVTSEYEFISKQIARQDEFIIENPDEEVEVYMEFYTFSTDAKVMGDGKVVFDKGDICSFAVEGMVCTSIEDCSDLEGMTTPHGKLGTKLTFSKVYSNSAKQINTSWKLTLK